MTTIDLKAISALVEKRVKAKRAEDEAVAARREVDAELAAELRRQLTASGKTYGTASAKLPDIGLKAAASFGFTRKVAAEVVDAYAGFTDAEKSCLRWKPEVVEAKFSALPQESKLKLSEYVTTTDDSPSIKIEVL